MFSNLGSTEDAGGGQFLGAGSTDLKILIIQRQYCYNILGVQLCAMQSLSFLQHSFLTLALSAVRGKQSYFYEREERQKQRWKLLTQWLKRKGSVWNEMKIKGKKHLDAAMQQHLGEQRTHLQLLCEDCLTSRVLLMWMHHEHANV